MPCSRSNMIHLNYTKNNFITRVPRGNFHETSCLDMNRTIHQVDCAAMSGQRHATEKKIFVQQSTQLIPNHTMLLRKWRHEADARKRRRRVEKLRVHGASRLDQDRMTSDREPSRGHAMLAPLQTTVSVNCRNMMFLRRLVSWNSDYNGSLTTVRDMIV